MSIYVTSLIWKFSKSDGSTLLTALAIADFCDDDGRAFPAVAPLPRRPASASEVRSTPFSNFATWTNCALRSAAGRRAATPTS